jgi:hypothetical protein
MYPKEPRHVKLWLLLSGFSLMSTLVDVLRLNKMNKLTIKQLFVAVPP